MEAVVVTGGKQYLVKPGDILEVEKLDTEAGKKVTLSEVLLVTDGKDTTVGTPFVKKAKVKAEVVEQKQGKKVVSFRYNRRKQYKRTVGHRQKLTVLKILDITPA